MTIQDFKEQLIIAKNQTDSLIEGIDFSKWLVAPEIVKTNLDWQIGHIILANYLHGIASITGPNLKIRELINVADFTKFYGPKSVPSDNVNDKLSANKLLEVYNFIYQEIELSLSEISDTNLADATAVPNPSAKTKLDALNRLINHIFWHNGQIAILVRVLKEIDNGN
jgi:hypothetical protein